jgi:hypothetical protein
MITLDTLAPNLTLVTMGTRAGAVTKGDRISVWFSYTTPVAIHAPGMRAPLTSVNEWSTTTGKHLNSVDGGEKAARARRVPHAQVMAEVDRLTPALSL